MLRPVSNNRVFQEIVAQIENGIIKGTYKPGDRLPTERELEQDLQTSRATIRIAMRVLEQKGLVRIKTGSKGGAYVTNACEDRMGEQVSFLMKMGEITFSEIAEFRFSLESTAFELATQAQQPEDLEELQDLLAKMEANISAGRESWREVFVLESLLHQKVCSMCGNHLIEMMLNLIHTNLWEYYEKLPNDPEVLEKLARDWHEIISIMQKKDVVKMGVLIRAHLLFSDRWFSG